VITDNRLTESHVVHQIVKLMRWINANGVDFITGLSPNKRLNKQFILAIREAELKHRRPHPHCAPLSVKSVQSVVVSSVLRCSNMPQTRPS
jgi:hypothetical protein